MTTTKILVIDDDPDLCRLLERALAQDGTEVIAAGGSKEALHTFYATRPDLVILDIMMPGMDGFEVCRRLRDLSDVPIIILTGVDEEQAMVEGLAYGADDYITKPFHLSVLRARVEAVLRRTTHGAGDMQLHGYSDDYLVVDLDRRRVLVKGELVPLSPTEYNLLATLVEHAGQVLTYQQLLERVWGWEYRGQIDYVHVYISRLRRKIEPDPLKPRYILTESRVGYRFEARGYLASPAHR
jgi:two-component system KDP operon response regulator KdpE